MYKLPCSVCGKNRKVFSDAIFDKKKQRYIIAPICIKCKSRNLDMDEVLKWEATLKNLEVQISKQIISDYFPDIKFKMFAVKKLTELMKKYSVRKVFKVCTLFNDPFNLHKIEEKCKAPL